MSDLGQEALDCEYHERLDTHGMVLGRQADIERGNTMIYTIENQKKLLADACQCQTLPDSNGSNLLVLSACCVVMPPSASQCQICATPTLL